MGNALIAILTTAGTVPRRGSCPVVAAQAGKARMSKSKKRIKFQKKREAEASLGEEILVRSDCEGHSVCVVTFNQQVVGDTCVRDIYVAVVVVRPSACVGKRLASRQVH